MIENNKDFNGQELAWEEIKTEHLVTDEWIDIRRSAYRFPDGSVFEPFYSYSRKDYVVIAATDEEGRYLCVRQYRQGIKEVTTEFPAGGIEHRVESQGDSLMQNFQGNSARPLAGNRRSDGKEYGAGKGGQDAEDALTAAKRELREETGYESDEWRHLLTVPSNATIADNYAYIFAAKNCRRVSGQKLDDTEFLKVCLYTGEELEELVKSGRFQQAVHCLAWMLSRQ